MARYAIGDIQGCFRELTLLLEKISFNPSKDTLYLVGDIINRGPQSLEVLEWIYKYQDSIICVLGNHELYLIGRYYGIYDETGKDTLNPILNSKKCKKLITWIKSLPLVFLDQDYLLVHAGVYPKFHLNKVMQLNHIVSRHLQSSKCSKFLDAMTNSKAKKWDETLDIAAQMKFFINSCTKMRYLKTKNLALDYKYKGALAKKPPELIPWFEVEFHPNINKKIVHGHWASLGFLHNEKIIALDTGCAWGRKLTAINLENYEIEQVDATNHAM